MFSPILNILSQYAGAVIAGVLVAFILKAYFAAQAHKKIRGYQGEIVKSHAKILELEAQNYRLETRIKNEEKEFSSRKMMMN